MAFGSIIKLISIYYNLINIADSLQIYYIKNILHK